jgi:hypothetical protein
LNMANRFDLMIHELVANRVPDSTVKINNWALNKLNSWLIGFFHPALLLNSLTLTKFLWNDLTKF